MAKNQRTSADSQQFGAERTMAPQRVKDTTAARGRQTAIGQHAGEGRPAITKK